MNRPYIRILGLVFILVFGPALYAQSTGKIVGVVTDKETGGPLAGCQVTVEGTTLGNITNDEGRYFILN
ncbi:MAG: hypothetical protein U9N45_07030, partial [Gemmatimonadota bacterium]|nr:hypothetical protein [Gemmatimonadota bacterium]